MYQNPANSLQRDSFPAHHPPTAPNGNGSKDWGRVRAPDAHHHLSDTTVFFPKIIRIFSRDQFIGHYFYNINYIV